MIGLVTFHRDTASQVGDEVRVVADAVRIEGTATAEVSNAATSALWQARDGLRVGQTEEKRRGGESDGMHLCGSCLIQYILY